MERTARITLWRARPPFLRRVTVRSFTVRSWMAFTRRASAILSDRKVKASAKWGSAADIAALELGAREWSDIADLACPEEPSGFFLPFFRTRRTLGVLNVRRLVAAMGDLRS